MNNTNNDNSQKNNQNTNSGNVNDSNYDSLKKSVNNETLAQMRPITEGFSLWEDSHGNNGNK